MKILIVYHSKTENTKKVAMSIQEGLIEEGQDVTLMPAEEVAPDNLGSYEFLVLGSGIYARKIGKSIIQLMKKAPQIPLKIACFQTYANLEWYPDAFNKAIGRVLKAHNATITEQFYCYGENLGMSYEQQQQLWSSYTPEIAKAREKHYEVTKGCPNAEDLENAKAFGKSLIKQ